MASMHSLFPQKQFLKCGYFTFDLAQKQGRQASCALWECQKRPRTERERESHHSLGGPCIHPDPAAATEAWAGEGPWVGKDNVESGNSLSHAAKLNPELVASVYCVGRLESKMRCGLSHGQHLQMQDGVRQCGWKSAEPVPWVTDRVTQEEEGLAGFGILFCCLRLSHCCETCFGISLF